MILSVFYTATKYIYWPELWSVNNWQIWTACFRSFSAFLCTLLSFVLEQCVPLNRMYREPFLHFWLCLPSCSEPHQDHQQLCWPLRYGALWLGVRGEISAVVAHNGDWALEPGTFDEGWLWMPGHPWLVEPQTIVSTCRWQWVGIWTLRKAVEGPWGQCGPRWGVSLEWRSLSSRGLCTFPGWQWAHCQVQVLTSLLMDVQTSSETVPYWTQREPVLHFRLCLPNLGPWNHFIDGRSLESNTVSTC